ncbi:MAG: Hpt domain-containing protein [Pseudomonadales bacterium]
MDTVEFRNTLLQAFSEEAPDLLGKAEKSFFDLDEADEFDQVSHCESLKRALHSFKGSASAIGRADIRDVCHAMEDMVLLIAQDQKLPERMDALQFGPQFLHIAAANPADSLDPENILSVLSNPALLQQIISTTDEPETPADEISEETATAQQKETETTKNTESQKTLRHHQRLTLFLILLARYQKPFEYLLAK